MTESRTPTVSEMVEALCLFDEPMLNSRYHGLLMRRGIEASSDEPVRLPSLVREGARLAREGAAAWESEATPMREGDFIKWAEFTVLESFLTLTESQLRIVAHISRSAPTARSRRPFDEVYATHRHIARVLRSALKSQPRPQPPRAPYRRSVQEEGAEGDLLGQLEAALDAGEESGSGVRGIVLSPVGLRHLRDQGCFQGGDATLRGHPVSVDLGWDAPAFVIETLDRVPLEEIMDP